MNKLSEDCLDGKVRKIPPAGSWDWEPIECAPKDGREIMLFHPAGGLFLTDLISTGHYDEDRYSKNPRPYWSVDRKFKDLNGLRKNPPKLWARIIPPV
jgi:hypothetical protein